MKTLGQALINLRKSIANFVRREEATIIILSGTVFCFLIGFLLGFIAGGIK